jgi:hypothetical protein
LILTLLISTLLVQPVPKLENTDRLRKSRNRIGGMQQSLLSITAKVKTPQYSAPAQSRMKAG